MIDSLINFIENGSLELVSRFFILYLLVLWILFPIWVYLDAKKRYNSSYLATIFFIFILPFNLPGFVFYLIIRPEHADDHSGAINHGGNYEGAVNIPVANFINDQGIVMSLNLSINNSVLRQDQDIKMNVHFDADKEKIQMQTIPVTQPQVAYQTIDTATTTHKDQPAIETSTTQSSFLGKIKSKLKENVGVVVSVIKNTDLENSTKENSQESENKEGNTQQLDIK